LWLDDLNVDVLRMSASCCADCIRPTTLALARLDLVSAGWSGDSRRIIGNSRSSSNKTAIFRAAPPFLFITDSPALSTLDSRTHIPEAKLECFARLVEAPNAITGSNPFEAPGCPPWSDQALTPSALLFNTYPRPRLRDERFVYRSRKDCAINIGLRPSSPTHLARYSLRSGIISCGIPVLFSSTSPYTRQQRLSSRSRNALSGSSHTTVSTNATTVEGP